MLEKAVVESPPVVDNVANAKKVSALRSLQQVLLVLVLFSIAFPALISGGILIRENFNRTITQDSETAAKNYADLLQAGMQLPLWNISRDLGTPLLDAISVDKSVLSIVVEATNDSDFLSYHKPDPEQGEESIPIERNIEYEGDLLGKVTLVYSLKEARNRAENESRLMLSVLFFQLIFSIGLLSFFLRKRVTVPLLRLERSAAGIATGDLLTHIPKLGSDEFGALSSQLEHMRGALSRSFQSLEERVRERTIDLEQVNEELKGTLDKLQHAQGELVQSEKMAALGSLVAGIAHELNTPIGNGTTVATTLVDYTQRMIEQLPEGVKRSDFEQYLKDMDEGMSLVCLSLEKASELVSSFKQVAVDRTSAQRRKFMSADLLKETRVTMATLMKPMPYTLEIHEQESVLMDSYPGPLGQVITNLLNNAIFHAFDERDYGHILISTTPFEDGVQIVVQDNGRGISTKNLNHIFDPFFTTKLGAGGNGLGLHIVHNIVTAALGGTIDVVSEINVGTQFIVRLPLVAPVGAAEVDINAEDSEPGSDVDDDTNAD
ncbi:MAG: two-component system NtrC family sensor kinase [Lentisphaeria bacterium]|jgi:two-component system NtrC family sensor kinase